MAMNRMSGLAATVWIWCEQARHEREAGLGGGHADSMRRFAEQRALDRRGDRFDDPAIALGRPRQGPGGFPGAGSRSRRLAASGRSNSAQP